MSDTITFRFKPLGYTLFVFLWLFSILGMLGCMCVFPFYSVLFILLYRILHLAFFRWGYREWMRRVYVDWMTEALAEEMVDTTSEETRNDPLPHLFIIINHGVFPLGGTVSTLRHIFHVDFGKSKRKTVVLGAKELLWVPFLSTFFQMGGFDGLTKETLAKYMRKGYNIIAIPYGFQEASRTTYDGVLHAVIKPGIFASVIKHKYSVKVRVVDEPKLFTAFQIPMSVKVRKWLHSYNIPTVIFYGYLCLPIPYFDQGRDVKIQTLPFQLNFNGTTDNSNPEKEVSAEELCELYKANVLRYRPDIVFHKD